MPQAIMTSYCGPTDTRGACIRVHCNSTTLYVSYDWSLNGEGNHREAARALTTKLNWHGTWAAGGAPDGRGKVYVNIGHNANALASAFTVPK